MKKLPLFSRNVIILSLVSFLNDIGGETIKKTIPLYLSNVLGVSPPFIGLVEGIAESIPQLLQPVAGHVSDAFGRRKPFILLGQLLRSLIMLLLFARTWPQILLVRILDRNGKGIYNSPRDALVTDSSEKGHVGRSFGLTRMFDNAGAVVGLLLASAIVGVFIHDNKLTQSTFQYLVLLSAIPLIIAFLLILFGVQDIKKKKARKLTFSLRNGLGKKYYAFLGVSTLFTLGNSSDAFLILRSQQVGIPLGSIFLLLALYSFVSSLSGLPLSNLSDKIGRKNLLLAGWFLYSAVYILFAQVTHAPTFLLLFILYGLYYGLTEGAAKAWIADMVPEKRRATAFGLYNMAIGLSLFPASLLAGFVWQMFGLQTSFYVGSFLSFLAALSLLLLV